jgi:hypothetical protein
MLRPVVVFASATVVIQDSIVYGFWWDLPEGRTSIEYEVELVRPAGLGWTTTGCFEGHDGLSAAIAVQAMARINQRVF